ncbi:MAG: hypothetical protein ACOYD6_07730 [Limnochordia bacterium]|jgi:hypothetical protein
MDLERGTTRIYTCPICQIDTPHNICSHRGGVYGIVCSNCAGGAIVREEDLRLYQLRWEEELRQILDNLTVHEDLLDDS